MLILTYIDNCVKELLTFHTYILFAVKISELKRKVEMFKIIFGKITYCTYFNGPCGSTTQWAAVST